MTAPPMTPRTAAATNDTRTIRSTGTPISLAAVMFSDVARSPRPQRLRASSQDSAATDASIAPTTQNPWVGMNSFPTVTGCDPENWLNANGLVPQMRYAAPSNAVSMPPIIISRLACEMRVTARRMTTHSMIPTPATTTQSDARNATTTGWWALFMKVYIASAPRATNAPWARFSAPLTLNTSE